MSSPLLSARKPCADDTDGDAALSMRYNQQPSSPRVSYSKESSSRPCVSPFRDRALREHRRSTGYPPFFSCVAEANREHSEFPMNCCEPAALQEIGGRRNACQLLQERLKLAQRFCNHVDRCSPFLHRLPSSPVQTLDLVRKHHALPICFSRNHHLEGIAFSLAGHRTTEHQSTPAIVARR